MRKLIEMARFTDTSCCYGDDRPTGEQLREELEILLNNLTKPGGVANIREEIAAALKEMDSENEWAELYNNFRNLAKSVTSRCGPLSYKLRRQVRELEEWVVRHLDEVGMSDNWKASMFAKEIEPKIQSLVKLKELVELVDTLRGQIRESERRVGYVYQEVRRVEEELDKLENLAHFEEVREKLEKILRRIQRRLGNSGKEEKD